MISINVKGSTYLLQNKLNCEDLIMDILKDILKEEYFELTKKQYLQKGFIDIETYQIDEDKVVYGNRATFQDTLARINIEVSISPNSIELIKHIRKQKKNRESSQRYNEKGREREKMEENEIKKAKNEERKFGVGKKSFNI